MLGSIHRKLNFWDKNGEVSGMDQTQSAISESGETPGNQSHEQNQEHQQNGDAEDETPPLKKIRRAPISEANSFLMKHMKMFQSIFEHVWVTLRAKFLQNLVVFSLCRFYNNYMVVEDGLLCFVIDLHEVVAGSAAWLGRGLSCVCAQRRESDARPSFDLTPSQAQVICLNFLAFHFNEIAHEVWNGLYVLVANDVFSILCESQEECLLRLQNRIDVAYDSSIPEHRFLFVFDLKEALKALWKVAFPEEKLYGLISEQWKEMGWQGKDPSTDFRGGGFISLENLLYFARNFPICPLSSLFLWENAMSNFLSICMHAGKSEHY
ncbi:hypothetical protein T459_25272 [Capsicum annuum]|uniref:ELMO domain-containing protein n=1 Tax=Capsicum annuum TaxID=4072 RepID=A0A2G2YKA1_CAPAN|nr:hypothetical protein T459_25272 [Capsicum annuum]